MKHPEFLLLPVLMFADYFLTLIGAVQSEKKYGQHFKMAHYELNPVWQKDVARKKWLNPRYILLVLVLLSLLFFIAESGAASEPLVEAVFGGGLFVFATLLGRHLANLMIFRHVIRNPEQLSGQVTMSHALALSISMYHCLVVGVPLAMVVIFMPSPFTVGGLFGVALLVVSHLIWIARSGMQAKRAAKPDAGGA